MSVNTNHGAGYNPLSKLTALRRISDIIGGLFALYCLFKVGLWAYNLLLHPLRKYPGPKLAAASSLPYCLALIQGNQVDWICSLHEQYGDVVRVAPNQLSYTQAEAWRDIYGQRGGAKGRISKDSSFYTLPKDEAPSMITTRDDEEHACIRRVFSHAFSDRALKQQEPLFLKYVDLLIQKLHETVQKAPEAEVNMVEFYNFTTFDIMGDLAFGEPLHLLEDSIYTPWVSAIFQGLKVSTYIRVVKHFPFLGFLLKQMIPKSLEEKRKAHSRYSYDKVDRRLEKGTDQPDIFNLVLSLPEGKGLSIGAMHSNASLFMFAGTETTATLLSGLTFYLLKNPEVMNRLAKEVRSAFATNEDITMERLAQLKYLNACVEEGLRMYPPVPIGLPRVTPPEGAAICSRWVPGRTTVYVSQLATYRSPANFYSPYSFIPERWIDEDETSTKDNKFAFQPFSYGPRNCLGRNMAYHETRLILAKVVWYFDLSLCKQSDRWADQKVYTLWEKRPLMCKLAPVRKT